VAAVIEQLFDPQGTVYYRVTFPDGNRAYCGTCWMAEMYLEQWNAQKYAVNYRGENLKVDQPSIAPEV
jgi:hypothetical protein